MLRGIKRAGLVLVAALPLAGCGFHLEGAGVVPSGMHETFIKAADRNTDFYRALRDALRQRGIRVVTSPEASAAVVSILEDQTGRRVMSVTTRNVPREYEVYYVAKVAVNLGSRELVAPKRLTASRMFAWDETEVLGKDAEEEVLRKALAADLARRVLLQLDARHDNSGATVPAPAAKGGAAATPSNGP